MKKLVWGILVAMMGVVALADEAKDSANATKLIIRPFGELGGLYNQGIASPSKHSYGNIMAHVGIGFVLDNGWDFGLGAIGGWTIWGNGNYASYSGISRVDGVGSGGSNGDVSEAYVHYKNSRLEFALGRFNTDFIHFDYLNGNIQGAAGAITIDGMHYWAIFADSMLYTGAHKNTSSLLYGMNVIYDYYPTAKRNIFGRWGEVIAAGLGYNLHGFNIDIFALLNTQMPANALIGRQGILVQVGGNIGYETDFGSAWHSKSVLRGIFQAGNTSGYPESMTTNRDAIAGFIWFDQSFKYRVFEFGAGIYSVLSSYLNGGIYTFSDPTRYYGKIINSPASFPSPYFSSGGSGQFINGYVFGSIDLMKSSLPFKFDLMLSFGRYQEYSAIVDYNVWNYKEMHFDVGVGYVFSKLITPSTALYGQNLQSSFLLFAKFYY